MAFGSMTLSETIVAGFAFVWCISLLRALIPQWASRKPLGCDICTSSWCALVWMVLDPHAAAAYAGAGGFAFLVLRALRQFDTQPPSFSEGRVVSVGEDPPTS